MGPSKWKFKSYLGLHSQAHSIHTERLLANQTKRVGSSLVGNQQRGFLEEGAIAMATAIMRTVSLRYFRCRPSSFQHCLPPIKSTPCSSLLDLHGNSTSLQPRLFSPLVTPLDFASQVSTLNCRYLASSTIDPQNPVKEKLVEAVSEEGEKTKSSNQTGDQGRPVRGGPVSWLSLLLLALTGGGLIFYYDNEKKRHIEELKNVSTSAKQGPSVGKAAIGGPFNLLNHDGRSVTDRDFLGKWTLIYFGFTHCPDICPDELQKLAAAIDKIKQKAGIQIVPVFISVDPERDTVDQVREYVKEFHPDLIGLTGNADEIRQVARAYRVYYMKTEQEDSDYLVDHSIVMYLMDPDMEFVKFFGKNNDVDALAEGIIKEIKQYRK